MKLYLSKDGVWEAPGKQSKGAEKIDVPTDTTGLVAFLNARLVQGEPDALAGYDVEEVETYYPTRDEIINSNTPEMQAKAKAIMNPDFERSWSATEIEDFILTRASTAEVENIFGCLGNRFATLAKAKVELTGLLD